jgi:predicted Zn-dependent protease
MMRATPQELIERAISLSTADGCAVIVRDVSRADLRWARTTLTTNGESTALDITVIAFSRSATGTATASIGRAAPDLADLSALVREAEAAAREAQDADDAFPLVTGDGIDPTWNEPAEPTSGAIFGALAQRLGEAFAGNTAIEHFGYAEHVSTTTWLGTSTGIRRRFVQPEGRLEMTGKSDGRTRSSWWGAATTDFTDVNPADGAAYLAKSLGWQARRVEIAPGRHDAILTSSAVGDLMVDLWWSAAGRDATEGRSVFSRPGGGTRIGDRIGISGISLSSNPDEPGMPSADFMATGTTSSFASVFDNGMALPRVDWIADGILRNLITTRQFADESGLALAAPADVVRMQVDSGFGSLEDLVARTSRGLLVTCLWYNRLVDPQTLLLTGLTRDGVYEVRDGEIVGAAGNFRFNDSPVSILQRITDSTTTSRTMPREFGDYANRVAMPALAVSDFHFSTASEAL